MLSDVHGQDLGVRYLRKVVEGTITDPLLLIGDEGVGRRFSVTEAAKEHWSKGNEQSPHCYQVDHKVHPDFILLEPPDGKEIGVESVRDLLRVVVSHPTFARVRYVVIDGIDTITSAAANALLKTLEQPPKTTRFFLLAQSSDRVLPTVRSRCGEVRYSSLSEDFLRDTLVRMQADPAKALVYSRLAEGSIGRATSYFGAGVLDLRNRMLGLLKLGLGGNLSPLFSAVDSIEKEERLPLGLRFLDLLLRDLTVVAYAPTRLANADLIEELSALRPRIGEERLMYLVSGLQEIRRRPSSTTLSFHVKSLLVGAFVG